jgi:hypothetical protein
METNVYAVYDKKAGTFGVPIFLQNDEVAKRALQTSVLNDPSFNMYPSDYSLGRLGTYNDQTGKITPAEMVEVVCEIQEIHTAAIKAMEDSRQMIIPETQPQQQDLTDGKEN